MFRLSSTPIQTFLSCPRKWFFSQVDPKALNSEAIRFGKLQHALLEATYLNFYETPEPGPLWNAVRNLDDGDYGGVDDLLLDEDLCQWAENIYYKVMESPDAQYLFGVEDLQVEADVTTLGVTMGRSKIPCRGRKDIFFRDQDGVRVIWDWKTRGDLKYAPFTDDEFRKSPQLAYYACVEHHANPEPQGIKVVHGNILRDSGRLIRYETHFGVDYLEQMYLYFDQHLVPAMEDAWIQGQEHVAQVEADETGCFKYGKCAYYAKCPANAEAGDDLIDTLFRNMGDKMKILSDEAPPEVKAIPIPQKPVAVLDGATERIAGILQEGGLFTLADMKQFLQTQRLTMFPGVGPVLEKRLQESLHNYYSEYVEV